MQLPPDGQRLHLAPKDAEIPPEQHRGAGLAPQQAAPTKPYLLRRPVKESAVPQSFVARGVLVHLVVGVGRQPHLCQKSREGSARCREAVSFGKGFGALNGPLGCLHMESFIIIKLLL